MSDVLGIDIGGTGIKAAPVNLTTGELTAKRRRLPTPQPATPDAMADVAAELVEDFAWEGPVGVGYPGVVQRGRIATAANLDKTWLGTHADTTLSARLGGLPVSVINDADAAGLAELRFGAGQDASGLVVMVTLGTGIGTAIFSDGHLVPNTEFGHLIVGETEAEQKASARARVEHDLSWKKWSKDLRAFLAELERLMWPDLFIIGGGISKEFARFCERVRLHTPVVPATMENQAGIVGAALATEYVAATVR